MYYGFILKTVIPLRRRNTLAAYEDKTEINIPKAGKEANTVVIVNHQPDTSISAGALSILFGIVGMFVFAVIFVPMGIVSGIIAIRKNQLWLGITGIFLSIVAIIFSPTFWAILRIGTGH